MKNKLILTAAVIVVLMLFFFTVEDSKVVDPSLVSKSDLVEIVNKVNRLNIDDFGYKRLMLFMGKKPDIEDMHVERLIMKRNLFGVFIGLKSYEIIISHKKRPVMIVYLEYRNDELHSVNYASIIDYDSIEPK